MKLRPRVKAREAWGEGGKEGEGEGGQWLVSREAKGGRTHPRMAGVCLCGGGKREG
jgi:hypothetical protein